MLSSRQLGYPQQIAIITWVDNGAVLPPSSGDPQLVRIGDIVYLRDTDGNLHPLVPGVDGAGIKQLTAATYTALPQDRVILVDSSVAATTITVPDAREQPLMVVQLGANNVTLSGSDINGSTSLTMNTLYQVREITWVAAFGAVTAKYVITGAVG